MKEDWDFIVLTASDEPQRQCFLKELTKICGGAVDLDESLFRVYEDQPAGAKIGGGGATLGALRRLGTEVGPAVLARSRVLLLHSGGQSQRQPHASPSGKLFLRLPKARPDASALSLLELKLHLYARFLPRMGPGVFLASADTLESFDLPEGWDLRRPGFTLLAHPSPLATGLHHGVYVVRDPDPDGPACLRRLSRVLQKPSEALMREAGAVGPDGQVLTDSLFFFSADVAARLLRWDAEHGPVRWELDAYGDFLQPLGAAASFLYAADNSRLSKPSQEALEKLPELRESLFHLLHDVPARALVLPHSRFFHLGTMPELLEHIRPGSQLSRDFGLEERVGLELCGEGAGGDIEGSVVESVLSGAAVVGSGSLVELSQLRGPTRLGSGCLVSRCQTSRSLTLPDHTLLMSVPVTLDGRSLWISLLSGTRDDIKRKTSSEDIPFLHGTLQQALAHTGQLVEGATSIWEAKLFPARADREESLRASLALHCGGARPESDAQRSSDEAFFSFADAMLRKDIRRL